MHKVLARTIRPAVVVDDPGVVAEGEAEATGEGGEGEDEAVLS